MYGDNADPGARDSGGVGRIDWTGAVGLAVTTRASLTVRPTRPLSGSILTPESPQADTDEAIYQQEETSPMFTPSRQSVLIKSHSS